MTDTVTSNITISYKGYDATVTETQNENYLWYASHSSDNTIITAYGKTFEELKEEYAKSINEYLNWLADESN